MAGRIPLRLLASTSNARGDLFTRLVGDLFFALGYDHLRYDVAKSGREIDVQGVHCFEPRRLMAECKANAERMGGGQVNKFRGVVEFERRKKIPDPIPVPIAGYSNAEIIGDAQVNKFRRTVEFERGRKASDPDPVPIAAYFVSLGGFTEAAMEQENELLAVDRLVLLDGDRVIEKLIERRIVIDRAGAAELAGRCAARAGLADSQLDGLELLGHPQLGYLWAVFYSCGKTRTHFALIHAGGIALATEAASLVLAADREGKGGLSRLEYLAPAPTSPARKVLANAALEQYYKWIATECGYVQLDGLPADADLSALRLQLERLYVPLKVVASAKGEVQTVQLGSFLAEKARISILAKPGGGKSTLLKRLAVAYAVPGRRQDSTDGLPRRDWLPFFLRCRELRDRANLPIRDILYGLAASAGLAGDEVQLFGEQVDDALRGGRALLLVDGLDEISEEGARSALAQNLRTFLGMFPGAAIVITSREAGYRQVAGVIASVCTEVRMANFEQRDVSRLCENWHRVVVDDSEKVRKEARELAERIWDNERIRSLAENPLMLTTLLVVRRSIGELPTRRVELYREAVKVLIRTWNTEGFAPLDLDEALAQLSYIAVAMMEEGIQQIGRRRLLELIRAARKELQEELQFTRTGPEEFLNRTESRSSLLMQTGHERIDGEPQPVYEFRHLTFQEYLAARGLVEEQYPGRNKGRTLVQILEPKFDMERWRETIPLAAILSGRKAEPVVRRLAALCEKMSRDDLGNRFVMLLFACLMDEVQLTIPTLQLALREIARVGEVRNKNFILPLLRGKFSEVLQEVVERAFFGESGDWEQFDRAMAIVAVNHWLPSQPPELDASLRDRLLNILGNGDRASKSYAILACMELAFLARANQNEWEKQVQFFSSLRVEVAKVLTSEDMRLALCARWALTWIGSDPQFFDT